MPELPEVETIVRQLQAIVGKKIKKIDLFDSKIPFLSKLVGAAIKSVTRKGKYILFSFSNSLFLKVHLRMTGSFQFSQDQKYLVFRILFQDGSCLQYHDIRRFGTVEIYRELHFSNLGPDPLEEAFTLSYFKSILKKKFRANIKTTLLDQKLIAGLGNIYAQEVLYYAHIDPQRICGDLKEAEIKKLYAEISILLKKAIKHNGTTVDNYQNLSGQGGFQKFLAVYQKEKCLKGHLLKRIVQGSRSTSYCPKCQK